MGTSAPTTGRERGWDGETIWAWVVERGRLISYVAGGVLVLVAVVVFWRESVARKNERAEAALGTAQSAFYSGNMTLAKSDLEKLITRYPGTAGGTQATILLAQILYGEGKHDDGINRLTAAAATSPSHFAPAVEELIASGYADTKRYDQAVEHLNRAAEKAPFAADKAIYRAESARLLALAGKPAEARKIWQSLADDPESPVANEARVRMGELDAKAAAKP
jgi:predicted negative regulator of RcsB-dependent stress response